MALFFFAKMKALLLAPLLGLAVSVASVHPVRAVTVFEDTFSDPNWIANPGPGGGSMPPGWTITNAGDLDALGACDGTVSAVPGETCYVDLDGNIQVPGELSRQFSLLGGQLYSLKFYLQGSGDGDADNVGVTFGAASNSFAPVDGIWTQFQLDYTPLASGNYTVSFLDSGPGDNIGAYLDVVSIETSGSGPEPGVPGPLPLSGAVLAWAQSRRLRRRISERSKARQLPFRACDL